MICLISYRRDLSCKLYLTPSAAAVLPGHTVYSTSLCRLIELVQSIKRDKRTSQDVHRTGQGTRREGTRP